MNNISKSSETDSSLKSNAMNQISLDALFSNLNKSLKNKFNSPNASNQDSSINSNSNKKYIDFFKFNQNYQSSNIKIIQNSPNQINNNQKDPQFFNENKREYNNSNSLSEPLGKKDFFFNNIQNNNFSRVNENSSNSSQPQNNEPKNIELVQHSSASITSIPSDFQTKLNSTQCNELSEKTDIDRLPQVKPAYFNYNNSNQIPQMAHISPIFLRPYSNNSINSFNNNNSYKKIKLSPSKLNFIPSEEWGNAQNEVTLENLISSYFHANCSSKIRFVHKLWNALKITLYSPQLFSYIGVKWVSNTIIQVNPKFFGNFLDLKKAASALFTSKGYFPSHGFSEIPDNQIKEELNERITPNDLSECRFFEHRNKLFRMDSSEGEIASIQSEASS